MSLTDAFDRLAAAVPSAAEHLPLVRVGRRLGKVDALGDVTTAINQLAGASELQGAERATYLQALLDLNGKLQELSRRYRGDA